MAGRGRRGSAAVAEPPAQAPAPEQPPASTPEAPADEQAPEQDGQANETGLALVEGDKVLTSMFGVRFSFTRAIVPDRISFDRLKSAYDFASGMREYSKWWQGDIIGATEAKHGEKYSELAEFSGQAEGSLRNVASLAKRFPPHRRRPRLSWSHHDAVKGLPDEVGDALLIEAEGTEHLPESAGPDRHGPWSVEQLRAEAREWREQNAQKGNATDATPAAGGRRPGVQPVDPASLAEGQQQYRCPNCPDLVFDVLVFHCLDCDGHGLADSEDCEGCAEVEAGGTATGEGGTVTETTTTNTTTAGAARQPDQIITQADRTGVSLEDLITVSSIRSLDVKTVAADLHPTSEAFAQIMALHEWIGRLIETAGATNGRLSGMAGTAAPKPSGKGRRRAPAKPAATPAVDDTSPEGGEEGDDSDLSGAFD